MTGEVVVQAEGSRVDAIRRVPKPPHLDTSKSWP